MPPLTPEMTAAEVVKIMKLLEENHIPVCVDGGWGVDALLGRQTRPHNDLDIAIPHKDSAKIRALLEALGYRDIPRDDTRDCNYVLGDEQGHLVDIHTYTFDDTGQIIYGVPYPFDSLQGSGAINGFPVTCITPEWMLKFHSGYELDSNDYLDVKALCCHFGFDLPSEYAKFSKDKLTKSL